MNHDARAEHGYSPAGFEQIVLDEYRLQQGNVSDFGFQLALSAVGHQMRTEPVGVERAIRLVVTHGDERVIASAASVMASILLEGVPQDQLASPIKFPVSFSLPDGIDGEERLAWQENVKVASAVVSAHAARDPAAIEKAVAIVCGAGTFEVMVVLVFAAARKLERHAAWLIEAMRCSNSPTTGPAAQANDA